MNPAPESDPEPLGPSLLTTFTLTAGSIPGREHIRLNRNNQDTAALHLSDTLLVAAITDGCSSGRYSEVGARLGAAHLAAWVPELWHRLGRTACTPADLARESTDALLAYLYSISGGLRPGGGEHLTSTLADYLLFSFLCLVIDQDRALIFGIGDGVYSLNGSSTQLDPGPDNAPDYLAYRLAGIRERQLRPRVHLCVPTAEVRSLLIGTDGLADLLARAAEPLADGTLPGGLEQFERDPLYLRNPVQVQKRLAVIGEVNRRLPDDTTLALVRRREEPR